MLEYPVHPEQSHHTSPEEPSVSPPSPPMHVCEPVSRSTQQHPSPSVPANDASQNRRAAPPPPSRTDYWGVAGTEQSALSTTPIGSQRPASNHFAATQTRRPQAQVADRSGVDSRAAPPLPIRKKSQAHVPDQPNPRRHFRIPQRREARHFAACHQRPCNDACPAPAARQCGPLLGPSTTACIAAAPKSPRQ